MLRFLITLSTLSLLKGDRSSCESDSSPLLSHSCPLVEKSSEDATLTSAFDGARTCQRSLQPQPELTTTSLNMTSGWARASHLSGRFSYDLHMGLFLDGGLSRAVTPDLELALGRKLWVKLEVRGVALKALGLALHRCWATPHLSPDAAVQHDLISDGCPDAAGATVAVISNGASLTSTFSFRAFRFVSELSRDVFLHCQAKLCVLADGCVPSCSPGTRA